MIMWYRLGSQLTLKPKSKEITGSRATSTQMGTWGFFWVSDWAFGMELREAMRSS
jgi:hypothetical protein